MAPMWKTILKCQIQYTVVARLVARPKNRSEVEEWAWYQRRSGLVLNAQGFGSRRPALRRDRVSELCSWAECVTFSVSFHSKSAFVNLKHQPKKENVKPFLEWRRGNKKEGRKDTTHQNIFILQWSIVCLSTWITTVKRSENFTSTIRREGLARERVRRTRATSMVRMLLMLKLVLFPRVTNSLHAGSQPSAHHVDCKLYTAQS